MPEILTESFCERCGTRYTFESAAPTKVRRLGKFKTISKGLKNYVMSDETSLDEAMAEARNEDERELTAQQLDAFHSTFNFCMTCRQYTCANCWNLAEGMCLTCAPHLGHEIMPAPFPDLPQVVNVDQLRIDAGAWPTMDLPADEMAAAEEKAAAAKLAAAQEAAAKRVAEEAAAAARLAAEQEAAAKVAAAAAEQEAAARRIAEDAAAAAKLAAAAEAVTLAAEQEAAVRLAADQAAAAAMLADDEDAAAAKVIADEEAAMRSGIDEREIAERLARLSDAPIVPAAAKAGEHAEADSADSDTVDERAAAAAAQTHALLAKFRPGQSIDAELEAFEAAAAPEPEPEPEPIAAVAPEPEPEPIAASESEADLETDRRDRVVQPTWQMVAPDVPAPTTNGHTPPDPGIPVAATAAPASPPAPDQEPQWPTTPEWPIAAPNLSVLADRASALSAATAALWAASARDVIAPPAGAPAATVQPCANCGLSLSANARFCRRCGSRQAA